MDKTNKRDKGTNRDRLCLDDKETTSSFKRGSEIFNNFTDMLRNSAERNVETSSPNDTRGMISGFTCMSGVASPSFAPSSNMRPWNRPL